MAVLIALLVIALLVGAILGWIAFVFSLRLRREMRALQAQMARLAAAPRAAPAPAAPETPKAAAPAEPTPPPAQPAAPTPAPAPASAAKPAPAPRNVFGAIEQSLAGNWLVIVAGVALALGGVFLVNYAVDQGFFTPTAQVIAAAIVGLLMIAISEWLRRRGYAVRPTGAGLFANSLAPAMTAGAGLVTVYGSIYAAFGFYDLIPGPVAFTLLAATATGAAALALLHGPALVVLALVGAFVAPALIGSDDPSAPALFAYVFAVAAVGLAVTRLVGRRWPALVALAGGAIWPVLWLLGGYRDDQAWALAVYLPALLAAAGAFAWDIAAEPPWLADAKATIAEAPVSILAAMTTGLVVALLQVWLAAASDHSLAAIASLAAASVIALAAAWRREGLFALPGLAAAGVVLTLYAWPEARAAAIDAETTVARALGVPGAAPEGPPYLSTCLSFAALFGLAGLFAQDRLKLKGPMAAVAAGVPTVILAVAYLRMTGLEQDWRWAASAVALAAAYTFLLERQAKAAGGPDGAPGPVAAYALAASGAAGMAVGMALEQLWMSVGFAVLVPVAALLHRRLKIPLLQWAAVGFGLIAAARLTIFGEVFDYDVGAWPVVNALLWGYGVPILAIWAAARVFMADGLARDGQVVQALHAKALILAVALVSMEIRHLLNGGDLADAYLDREGLIEAGLQSSAWLGGALALRWRLGPHLYFVQRWTERLLIAAALLQTLFIQLWWINPWWGPQAWPLDGPPIWNALLLGYLLPCALAAVYALVARAQGFARIGTAAGLAGAALAFAWATLETRHFFHPVWLTAFDPDGNFQVMTAAEHYAYSAVWLVFAAALLGLGAMRRRPSMRYAALGLLVIVTLKVFLFDLAGLEGALRGLSFLGLGAALMAIGLLYQRLGARLQTARTPGGP